jgi:hypothetical protein
MDLLEQLSKEKAHLPIQDVLSIFFQVAAPSNPCVLCTEEHMCVTQHMISSKCSRPGQSMD